jgi:hypothetical protein
MDGGPAGLPAKLDVDAIVINRAAKLCLHEGDLHGSNATRAPLKLRIRLVPRSATEDMQPSQESLPVSGRLRRPSGRGGR